MDFFSVIERRRSIRRYTKTPVPEEVMRKALQTAVLAPTSSNAQVWNFYWTRTPEKKKKLVEACLSQSAARTAQELVVIVASPHDWRRSWQQNVEFVKSLPNPPKGVVTYYQSLFPMLYRWDPFGVLAIFRTILFFVTGLFRPITRGPATKRDIQEVSIKSAALAAENFVLAISAQGFSTCMMEGFDEARVKRLLGLRRSERVVMVISVGEETADGTWGHAFAFRWNKSFTKFKP